MNEPDRYQIYPYPTVVKVIFQIRFSNLFIIENKIGEFQSEIIERFPESSLNFRRQLVFADVGPKFDLKKIDQPNDLGVKIWQFKSEGNYVLNVITNSLDITSEKHKSYYNNIKTGEEGFREIIKFTMDNFLKIIPLAVIKRIGLRYTDESPIPGYSSTDFYEWYNSALPLEKFDLKDILSMNFSTNTKRGQHNFIFRENIIKNNNEMKYTMDFDGFTENIKAENYLNVLDDLHDLVNKEYESLIKEPVREYMRQRRE